MKKKLSVCIIAKNEEKNLLACLESVKSIADEIILVDTGSSDKTIEIAKRFDCRIFEKEWRDDFSDARNEALSHAKCEFILSIDADERLVNPEAVLTLFDSAQDNTGGWLVNVVSEARGKDGRPERYSARLLRLFLNMPEIRFKGIIHEQVADSIVCTGLKIAGSEINFLHTGYAGSPEQRQSKQKRNLGLLNKAIDNDPGNAYLIYQRAKTYLALGNTGKAENDIETAIKHAPPSGTVKPMALAWGANIALQNGNGELAIARARESLMMQPDQTFAHFILGEAYTSSGDHAAAYEAYKKMEDKADTAGGLADDYSLPPEQLHFRLGRSLIGLKIFDSALKEFENGFRINPNDINCLVGLANISFQYKKFDESLAFLKRATEIAPDVKEIRGFMDKVKQTMSKAKPVPTESSKSQKPLLSLSMIVKNEEEMLPGCLDSARGLVDEIVIVDTGSTDRTIEIAKEYGANIHEFEWTDDFAAARNESLKHCTGQWILYLDADERLNNESAAEVRDLLINAPSDCGGFFCTIESDHAQLDGSPEKHRGGYPRIFRNYGYPKIEFRGRVHEQITPSITELGSSFLFSEVIIEHLGYNQPREIMEQKIKRNYRMLLEHVKEEPLNGYAWYQLGQTLGQMQLKKEAEDTIRFAIKTGNLSDSVYASAAASLAQMSGNKKKFDEALHWAEQSLAKAPEQVYALNLKAYSLLYLDRLDEAEECFRLVKQRLLAKKGVPKTGFDIDIPESVIDHGLLEVEKRKEGGS